MLLGEGSRGHDADAAVLVQHEQVLITSDKHIDFCGLAQREQVVVLWIPADLIDPFRRGGQLPTNTELLDHQAHHLFSEVLPEFRTPCQLVELGDEAFIQHKPLGWVMEDHLERCDPFADEHAHQHIGIKHDAQRWHGSFGR